MWTTCFQVSCFDVLCIPSVGLLPLWLDFKQSCSALFSCEIDSLFLSWAPPGISVFFSGLLKLSVVFWLAAPCKDRTSGRGAVSSSCLCRRWGLSALAFFCCVTSYYKPSNWRQLCCVLLEFPGAGCRRVLAGYSALGLTRLRSRCWPDTSRLRPGPLPGSLDPWSFAQVLVRLAPALAG